MLSGHHAHIGGPANHEIYDREVELVDRDQYLFVLAHPAGRAERVLAEAVVREHTPRPGVVVRDIERLRNLTGCQVEGVRAAESFKGAQELLKSFTDSEI